jgi:ribosomal protein S18 acetylase RimI-like enzyme
MTEGEYEAWLEPMMAGYAAHHVAEGNWSEDGAQEGARTETMKLLPDGLATADSHLFTARDAATGDAVAIVWFALQPKAGRTQAFIYDIEVYERYRGQRYGKATMRAAAERARAVGAATVGLHVHGRNAVARSLYRSLGYVETDVTMSLEL